MEDARNLIRWCLMGPISKRPSIDEVLGHRFLCPHAAQPEHRGERFHAFMSHAQADASGTANTLYLLQPIMLLTTSYLTFVLESCSGVTLVKVNVAWNRWFSYAKLGLTNWLDMRQRDLTLRGMRQGVRDSDVFLIILTERLLLSWYCQQELLCAIEHQKPIQIVSCENIMPS